MIKFFFICYFTWEKKKNKIDRGGIEESIYFQTLGDKNELQNRKATFALRPRKGDFKTHQTTRLA